MDSSSVFIIKIGIKEYRLRDVAKTEGWGDVLVVESILYNGKMACIVNHRERSFEQRKLELIGEHARMVINRESKKRI